MFKTIARKKKKKDASKFLFFNLRKYVVLTKSNYDTGWKSTFLLRVGSVVPESSGN